jgi:hypothetical protein
VESPGDDEEVVLEPRSLPLPFGELVLTSDPAGYFWGGYRFNRFIPVGEFVVRGFSNPYRQAGVRGPLAAELKPLESAGPAAEAARTRIPLRTPATESLNSKFISKSWFLARQRRESNPGAQVDRRGCGALNV